MTFDNNNSLKPTKKEEGVTQSGLIEKKVKDIENQIDDIKERLTPLENTVEDFEHEVNTDSVIATEVSSSHEYTDALSVSGDADVQGELNAAKVTAADIEASNKVKTKDIDVTGKIEASEADFGELSAEIIDIENFNVDELNAEEIVSENVDTTNLAADNLTAENATLKEAVSETLETDTLKVNDKITGKDAELSGKLEAGSVEASEMKVSDELNALKVISETMQTGRVFIAPEQLQMIPENGWIHFHNVNAGRFIIYLTDFTDDTTNIHSLGNVLFTAVINYVNNTNKGAVKMTYVQPALKAFETVYIADNGELWLKRSPQYLNARRCVVFAESEKELIVDTFAENAQTFDISEAKSITLKSYNNDAEIISEKYLKGDYVIDGNIRITGYLTPGQVISERALFLGYSNYVTADSDGMLSAKGAVIDGNLSVVNDATINGDNTVSGDETIGGTLSVTGNTDLDADLNVDGETSLNDDVTVTGDVAITGNESVSGTLDITGDVTISGELNVTGNTDLHNTEINGTLSVNGDIIQNGSAYETHAEKLYTKKDIIITRDGAVSALPSGELTGITAKHYDSQGNDGVLGFDNTGTARVGDKGENVLTVYSSDGVTFYEDAEMTIPVTIPTGITPQPTGETDTYTYTESYDETQPILTREEENVMVNNKFLKWDSVNKKAVTSTIEEADITALSDELLQRLEAQNGLIVPTCRWLRFTSTDKKSVKIVANTLIKVGSKTFFADTDKIYDLSTYLTNAGINYFIYLNVAEVAGEDVWTISATDTKVADTSSSRYIGRLHTLCANVAVNQTMLLPTESLTANTDVNISPYTDKDSDFVSFYTKSVVSCSADGRLYKSTFAHPLAGFSAGDIIPESIWCLTFHPECKVEDAMIYEPFTGRAIDIYLQSGTGTATRSAYNATHTVSRTQWNYQSDMLLVGKRLLKDYEFTAVSLGSPQKTNIAGSSDKTTVGGHSDTNGNRMISMWGAEECCGYMWQWLEEYIHTATSTSWNTEDGSSNAPFGQSYWIVYALITGGGWNSGANSGSHCRSANNARSTVDVSIGGRGSSRVKRGF